MSGNVTALDHSRNVTEYIEVDQSLLKSPVVFCTGNVFGDLRKLLPASVHVWRLLDADSLSLEIEIADNQIRALRCPPLFTAALVASDTASLTLATEGAAWLREHGARVVPEPTMVSAENMSELAAGLIERVVRLLTTQAEFITTLSRELASFRMSNESLQNHFSAVEAVLARKGLQPYDLDFVNEPVDSHSNVLKEATQNRVAQILPVGSTGVSAVGLHLAEVPARSDGFLKVQITSLEDGVVFDTWSVPISALQTGWNVFGFERSLAGLPRTLELTVTASGSSAQLPSLSLGAPQPIERFRVHDADSRQAVADAGLALQVWTGLASVALPNWATYWSSRPGPGRGLGVPLRQEAIAPDILGFAALYNADEVSFPFEAVQALIPERAISCHPPAIGMTVARLPGACPAGALRVSACVLVDNALSREIEFALVTSTDGARARSILSGDITPAAGESFSTWIKVPPMEKKAVNAFISQPIARWQDIYVATRMVEPGNNNFAWAKFQDLTAVFQDLA